MKVDVKRVNSIQIVSYFNDFDGEIEKWQSAYFQLLSWRNTWDTAYVLDINDSRTRGAFVRVIPHNPETADSVIEMMEGLGYRGFMKSEVKIGLVEYCDLDEIVFE